MSDKTNTSAEDIDLLYVYNKVKKIARGWLRSIFKAYDYCLKYWYILVALAVVGAGLAYFLEKGKLDGKHANVLVKVNFDAGNYLYNSVDVLNQKILERDDDFLKSIGFSKNELPINNLELEPIIDVKDITDDFENTDRNLDALLRYVEFNMEEEELYQTFAYDYQYHTLSVSLSPNGTKEDLAKILAFINDSEILKDRKNTAVSTVEKKLKDNEATVSQIDMFLAEYLKAESERTTPNAQYYVERNTRPDLLLNNKSELLQENKELREELVYYKDAVVAMSGMEVYPVQKGLLDNKMIVYPIALIALFLFFSLMLHVYRSLRDIANQEDD